MSLLGKLQAVQAAHGWTDAEMADRCGIKARMWALLKGGDAQFSSRVLGSILRSFPGLRDDVNAYLLGLGETEATEEAVTAA